MAGILCGCWFFFFVSHVPLPLQGAINIYKYEVYPGTLPKQMEVLYELVPSLALHHFQQLIQGRANEVRDEGGRAVLSLACIMRDSSPELIEMILKQGGDPRDADSDGWTSLHYAVLNVKNSLVLELLIDAGGDVNATTMRPKQQCTPLHCAVICLLVRNVEVLLRRGANTLVKDSDGNVALDLVRKIENDIIQDVSDNDPRKEAIEELFAQYETSSIKNVKQI
jgi:ankyrin repeat protein